MTNCGKKNLLYNKYRQKTNINIVKHKQNDKEEGKEIAIFKNEKAIIEMQRGSKFVRIKVHKT